ncbi:hypothetical protein C8J57DRAFT_1383955 [Mycena rebaudengoi]|nr:hypothetical protein C8J57DRAFT_1383955 [Mycena rebaudengoi]
MPPKKGSDPGKAKWIEEEVNAMLDALIDRKASHQSGNGWKPAVWADVVAAVQASNPEAKPTKDQVKVLTKLNYLKEAFELYVFVEKYSGSGWDPDEKHACATDEYIESFVKSHGSKYAKCFKKPCPFYTQLDSLYSGGKNKANGEHVVHFKKSRTRKGKNTKENSTSEQDDAANATASSSSKPITPPFVPEVGGGIPGPYDDELLLVSPPKASGRRQRAESDDDENENTQKPRKRQKSDPSATARRNAEAGSQLSHSVDNLSAAMSKPIVTTEDLSHVDQIIDILRDKSLLPPDPKGKLFRLVSASLSRDPASARIFILETDVVRRKGILEGIMEDAGIEIPPDY